MNNLQAITIDEENELTIFLYDGIEYTLPFDEYNPDKEIEELEREGVNTDLYEDDSDAILNSLVMYSDNWFTQFFKNAKKINQ